VYKIIQSKSNKTVTIQYSDEKDDDGGDDDDSHRPIDLT
jgi:hypothetical protein